MYNIKKNKMKNQEQIDIKLKINQKNQMVIIII